MGGPSKASAHAPLLTLFSRWIVQCEDDFREQAGVGSSQESVWSTMQMLKGWQTDVCFKVGGCVLMHPQQQ